MRPSPLKMFRLPSPSRSVHRSVCRAGKNRQESNTLRLSVFKRWRSRAFLWIVISHCSRFIPWWKRNALWELVKNGYSGPFYYYFCTKTDNVFNLLRQNVVDIENRPLSEKVYPSSTICLSRISLVKGVKWTFLPSYSGALQMSGVRKRLV